MCALAFALVVIYISVVLKRVSSTMETLGSTLGDVEKKLQYLTPELRNTVNETEKMVEDLNGKITATDGLFDSLENIGSSLNACNQILYQQTKKLPKYTTPQIMNQLAEGFMWSEVGLKIYNKWKKRNGKNEIAIRNENLSAEK